MLIDWFTIGAQVLNFLILVWLLKHFLYKPILNAVDAREKLIAAELADAAAKKAEAKEERDEFQHKNEEFDQQRAALLSKVTEEANTESQRLLDEARKAADALSAKRQKKLKNDAHNLNQAISRRTQQEVFAIARKALMDLAATSLEERMAEVFTRRLREMDGKAKAGFAEALKTAPEPAIVRSAFDLPAEQCTAMQNALNETFSAEIHVRFETAPDLVSGIELTTNGQKVAWSIEDYLAELEKGVDELLKENDKREAKEKTPPDVMTPQIAKRAYELYEQQGRKSDSADQNWSQAVREIREDEVKAEPKSETKAETTPEVNADRKSEKKVEPKSEAKEEPKPEPKSKPEAKVELIPEDEADTKSDVKTEPKPKAKVESKAETKVESEPEIKVESKPEEPESKTKSK